MVSFASHTPELFSWSKKIQDTKAVICLEIFSKSIVFSLKVVFVSSFI